MERVKLVLALFHFLAGNLFFELINKATNIWQLLEVVIPASVDEQQIWMLNKISFNLSSASQNLTKV